PTSAFRDREPLGARFARLLYPELKLCRSPLEVSEAIARQKRSAGAFRIAVGPTLLYVVVIAIILFAPRYVVPQSLGPMGPLIAIMAISLLFSLWMTIHGRDQARRRIRSYLLSRGVPTCLECGYDLRGVNDAGADRCPECGESVPESLRAGVPGA